MNVKQEFWEATAINAMFTIMLFFHDFFIKPSDYITIGMGIATSFIMYARIADKALEAKK